MSLPEAVRPRRPHALALVTALFPALYVVYRDANGACPADADCLGATHVGYALAGLAGSYLFAVLAVAVVDAESLAADSPLARLALFPSDLTLGVLGAIVAGLGAYAVASLAGAVPTAVDAALAPVGLLVGLPFAATAAALVLVGSAVSATPPLAFRYAVVAGSLALTGGWVFALATGAAALVRRASAVEPDRE
ncbi:hypothetical protein [Halorussus marinus]|uniref:hypothetical protein n=1 Tax=Halorussus marinus TaxID=2505976 RepID=UPI00106E577F|nr:hypothetical protein [Halorussus marinus]